MRSDPLVYPFGTTPAVEYAAKRLYKCGIATTDHPCPEITHLLLDVPSNVHDSKVHALLEMLPQSVTVIGGKLMGFDAHPCIDLLEDPLYLAHNARITAQCVIGILAAQLPCTFDKLPVCILGWGRIGKCLGLLLKNLGANVTIAARKAADRAITQALGYHSIGLDQDLSDYRLVINTIPATVLSARAIASYRNALKIDLASEKGLPGEDVLWARGLPGKFTPESSGILIADTTLRLIKEQGSW